MRQLQWLPGTRRPDAADRRTDSARRRLAKLERHDVGSFGRETGEDPDVQMLMFGH